MGNEKLRMKVRLLLPTINTSLTLQLIFSPTSSVLKNLNLVEVFPGFASGPQGPALGPLTVWCLLI